MQQRLREARIESLARSVDRRNGHKRRWTRLFRRNGGGDLSLNGTRRGHADVDFHDRGEDVWKALRD
jgi:transposase-like protein